MYVAVQVAETNRRTWRSAFLQTFFGPNCEFFQLSDEEYLNIAELIYQLTMLSELSYSEIYNMRIDKRYWMYKRTIKWHEDQNEAMKKNNK